MKKKFEKDAQSYLGMTGKFGQIPRMSNSESPHDSLAASRASRAAWASSQSHLLHRTPEQPSSSSSAPQSYYCSSSTASRHSRVTSRLKSRHTAPPSRWHWCKNRSRRSGYCPAHNRSASTHSVHRRPAPGGLRSSNTPPGRSWASWPPEDPGKCTGSCFRPRTPRRWPAGRSRGRTNSAACRARNMALTGHPDSSSPDRSQNQSQNRSQSHKPRCGTWWSAMALRWSSRWSAMALPWSSRW